MSGLSVSSHSSHSHHMHLELNTTFLETGDSPLLMLSLQCLQWHVMLPAELPVVLPPDPISVHTTHLLLHDKQSYNDIAI